MNELKDLHELYSKLNIPQKGAQLNIEQLNELSVDLRHMC